MLNDMVEAIKNAEKEASGIISEAESNAEKIRADAEKKADDMKLSVRQDCERKTALAIDELKAAAETADKAQEAETEKIISRLKGEAGSRKGVLRDKLAQMIFS